MNLHRSIFSFVASVLLMFPLFVASARGDLLVKLTNGIGGGTHIAITGSLELSGGQSVLGSPVRDRVFGSIDENTEILFLERITTPASNSSVVTLGGHEGNPQELLTTDSFSLPTGWGNADDVSLHFYNRLNIFQGIAWDDASTSAPTAIHEDVTYGELPFSSFNPGTWIFGNTTDSIEGNGVTLMIEVPEPSAFAIVSATVLSCGITNRRSTRMFRLAR